MSLRGFLRGWSLLLVFVVTASDALQCLQCDRVAEAHDCKQLVTCTSHEKCYVQRFISSNLNQYYKLGCASENICLDQTSLLMVVGKRNAAQSKARHLKSRGSGSPYIKSRDIVPRQADTDMVLCLQCCGTDGCNGNLCGSPHTDNLRCLSCPDVLHPKECDQVEECSRDNYCYVRKGLNLHNANKFDIRHELGCMNEHQCRGVALAYQQHCVVCCNSTDFCNYAACDTWTPPAGTQVPFSTTSVPITTAFKVPTHPHTTNLPSTLAPQVAVKGANQTNYNATVELSCVALPPAQSYEWRLNGSSSLPSDVTSRLASLLNQNVGVNILTISHLNEATMGNYQCVANTYGHEISVIHPLSITPEAPTAHITKGPVTNNFSLKCSVTGYPMPAVRWDFHPDQIGAHGLPPGLEYSDIGYEHTIFVGNYKQTDHGGTYSCMASNSLGSATDTVSIP